MNLISSRGKERSVPNRINQIWVLLADLTLCGRLRVVHRLAKCLMLSGIIIKCY